MSNAVITQLPAPVAARQEQAAPIRAHLAVRGVSASSIARQVGLSQPQLSRRLTGRLPFTTDDLNAIAAVLGLSVVELIQMPTGPVSGVNRLATD